MRIQIRPIALFAALIATLLLPLPLAAQSQFAPVIRVNDKVITQYEINQRAQLLRLLRAPGDPITLAREQLVEDRLKVDAAQANGVGAAPEAVQAGMEEFAGRANMSAEQFIRALKGGGVAEQTFRDFGTTWRIIRQSEKEKIRVGFTNSHTPDAAFSLIQTVSVDPDLPAAFIEFLPEIRQEPQNLFRKTIDIPNMHAFS